MAARCSKTVLCERQSRKLAGVTCTRRPVSFNSCIATTRSAFGYWSGLSRTALTTEKIAVFAPTPTASVSTATAVKPGRFASERAP